MLRSFLLLLTLPLLSGVVSARVAAPPPPATRALDAGMVIVGKVTSIEEQKRPVKEHPNSTQPSEYTMAVIKIEKGLIGSAGLTHVKVGYLSKANPGIRPAFGTDLQVGEEAIFFLSKHPVGGFDTFNYWSQPVPLTGDDGKDALTRIERVAKVITNPKEALAAKETAERTYAAAILITKYRTVPKAGESRSEPMPLEESQAILKALAETDWSKMVEDGDAVYRAFTRLGLTAENDWVAPIPKPNENFMDLMQSSFRKWLQGAGKGYRIQRIVPSK